MALKAAYIDEHESRFGVGPICRVLSESLDRGFLAPRDYHMFENRSVSPMQARREALACDILQIHSDFFMTVYGHRKTHARLIAQGWDSGEVGRDQVMRTMRELVWRRKPFRDLADLELATFRWVLWRGLEAAAPVIGLQDTGRGGNRVLCKSSGTSRLTMKAEQKSGHITGSLYRRTN